MLPFRRQVHQANHLEGELSTYMSFGGVASYSFLGKKHHLPRNTFGLYLSTGGVLFHVPCLLRKFGIWWKFYRENWSFLGLRWNWTWKCHPTHPRDHRPTPPALAVEVIARWATLIGHRREQESHGRCAHNLGWWWSLGWWDMYIRKKNITSIPANPWWKWMEMFFNGSKWRGVASMPLIASRFREEEVMRSEYPVTSQCCGTGAVHPILNRITIFYSSHIYTHYISPYLVIYWFKIYIYIDRYLLCS